MGEYATAIITTLVLTGLFSVILVSVDIEAIKGDWANRRCEFPIMTMAPLFKPDDYTKSRMEFAMDNFNYCSEKGIQNSLKTAFAPLYSVAGKQANTLNSLSGPLNSIRATLKQSSDNFGTAMNKNMHRYNLISAALLKSWHHITFAFGRIQGIFFSAIYMGLSLNTLIENMLGFTFRAIIIFLSILVVLMILLFFVLFPYMPLIMTVLIILVAAGFGAAAGLASSFCIDPDALVCMADGTKKQLKNILVGDRLATSEPSKENVVTGILEAESSNTPLVNIESVLMSESHRIKFGDDWILAKRHPNAKLENKRLPRLICLNTTMHEVIIETSNKYKLFVSDWEEVSDEQGRKLWINAVHESLNSKYAPLKKYPNTIPLISPSINVIKKYVGKVPINSIKIGDMILTSNRRYTKVTGTYKGQIKSSRQNQIGPEWISDGVWIQSASGIWSTADGLKEDKMSNNSIEGVYLITEDETFIIQHGGDLKHVRDFTEIGASQIDSTYEMLDANINKK